MTSLYEVLKRSKTAPQLAPDMFTALWAKSITAGKIIELSGQVPLSFKANGEPLIDYTISGNTVQSGTPTPDNPIMPQGCGNYSNLFNEATAVYGKYIDSNGVEQTSSTGENNHSAYIPIKSGLQYTLSETKPNYNGIVSAIAWYTSSKVFIRRDSVVLPESAGRTSNTWTAPSNAAYAIINFYRYPYFDGENDMLNEGSTALPYEPYGQYKIPISSASTTTPVYLGEVETTRKIKKLVLTGKEPFFRDREIEDSWRFYSDALISAKDAAAICSHFENIGTDGVNNSDNIGFCIFYKAQFGCRFPKSIAATVADFKSWLAAQYANGTPVTVWYTLATPETGIVNEPLMKIGDYADTLSMEQAGVQIPTNKGSTTLDVLTAVKPSNVSIKYRV